jgi:hypothetical protein
VWWRLVPTNDRNKLMTLITEVGGNLTQWDLTRGPRIEIWLMNKWLSWANIEVSGANSIIRVWDANYVMRFRFDLFPQLNWTRRDTLESHRSPRSTPVVENKRKKGSNRAKGYLSSRVSWPSLVAGPLGGDEANLVLLRRTTANWVRRTLAVVSRTRDSKT